MHILHVIASVDPKGGGPIEGITASAIVWGAHGHERNILCLEPPEANWIAKWPVKIFSVGCDGVWYRRLRRLFPWLRYGYTPRLGRWLREHAMDYDGVVINGLWNYASYGTWRTLRELDRPYFVFTHGMLDPWFNRAYPTKTFFKTIVWKLFEHKVLRDARGVFFTSDEERRLAPSSFSPYKAREFVVGYGTCDVDGDPEKQERAFMATVPQIKGRAFILFLSRIHPKKGVDLLIHAFARNASRFPEIDLVIAGPDQTGWMKHLRKLAVDKGIADRVHWPGMLSGDAKWGAFRCAEFFVLPSHQENFGIVIAEAMALGKPVLVTNKVNIWREIEADNAGLVVNDDVDALTDGLRQLCALTPAQRRDIGRNGRECFLTRYNLETNAMGLLELMLRLSEERAPLQEPNAGEACAAAVRR